MGGCLTISATLGAALVGLVLVMWPVTVPLDEATAVECGLAPVAAVGVRPGSWRGGEAERSSSGSADDIHIPSGEVWPSCRRAAFMRLAWALPLGLALLAAPIVIGRRFDGGSVQQPRPPVSTDVARR